jgi:hypothetical protein
VRNILSRAQPSHSPGAPTSTPQRRPEREGIPSAISIVAVAPASLAEPAIKRQALAVFGGKRMTEVITARLGVALS